MVEKPRVRVQAGNAPKSWITDSFVNLAANLGVGADNLTTTSSYNLNPVSRYHTKLEWMYRGSWLVRKVVDSIANDMTRAGIAITSEEDPKIAAAIEKKWKQLRIWNALRDTLKWARLYGGALAFILIEGEDESQPLRIETIGKGTFKGLYVLDRWMVTPSVGELIEDIGPDLGMPKYYETIAGSASVGLPALKMHHTRVIRFDGDPLPYWQRLSENGWSASIVEQLYDRMIAFDSATAGAAQLVYKAHLRTYKVKDLRELVAAGGGVYTAFLQSMQFIRMMQSSEGLTLIDAEDELEYHTNSAFSGLSDALTQFGQQLSGACGIPLVVLFGQSPSGFNSGDSDLRNYYDRIKSEQESALDTPVAKLLRITHQSETGQSVPVDFGHEFVPLWQMTAEQKISNAAALVNAVTQAHADNLISQKTGMLELKQASVENGVFTNISAEDIAGADDQLPQPEMGGGLGPDGQPFPPGADDPTDPGGLPPPPISGPPGPGPAGKAPVLPAGAPAEPAMGDDAPAARKAPGAEENGMAEVPGIPLKGTRVRITKGLPVKINYIP